MFFKEFELQIKEFICSDEDYRAFKAMNILINLLTTLRFTNEFVAFTSLEDIYASFDKFDENKAKNILILALSTYNFDSDEDIVSLVSLGYIEIDKKLVSLNQINLSPDAMIKVISEVLYALYKSCDKKNLFFLDKNMKLGKTKISINNISLELLNSNSRKKPLKNIISKVILNFTNKKL